MKYMKYMERLAQRSTPPAAGGGTPLPEGEKCLRAIQSPDSGSHVEFRPMFPAGFAPFDFRTRAESGRALFGLDSRGECPPQWAACHIP